MLLAAVLPYCMAVVMLSACTLLVLTLADQGVSSTCGVRVLRAAKLSSRLGPLVTLWPVGLQVMPLFWDSSLVLGLFQG
jgi:hypothetical protein